MADRHKHKRRIIALNPEQDQKLERFRKELETATELPNIQRLQALSRALDIALETISEAADGPGRIRTGLTTSERGFAFTAPLRGFNAFL